MIWLAVSVFLICATVLVIGWRAEPLVRRAIALKERPVAHWTPPWAVLLEHLGEDALKALRDRPPSVLPTLAEKAVPLIERWLAYKEHEFAETHKPAPKPEKMPMLPPDLLNVANQWKDAWARDATATALQELGIKCEGDWDKVRGYVMTDPSGNS